MKLPSRETAVVVSNLVVFFLGGWVIATQLGLSKDEIRGWFVVWFIAWWFVFQLSYRVAHPKLKLIYPETKKEA